MGGDDELLPGPAPHAPRAEQRRRHRRLARRMTATPPPRTTSPPGGEERDPRGRRCEPSLHPGAARARDHVAARSATASEVARLPRRAHPDRHRPTASSTLLRFCRDDPDVRCELLADLSACTGQAAARRVNAQETTGWPTYSEYGAGDGRIEVNYILYSRHPQPPFRAAREPARTTTRSSPSATTLYASADFMEREIYDFFGVHFDGHPNLKPLHMPDDWDGHPQRKDYPLGGVEIQYKGETVRPDRALLGREDCDERDRTPATAEPSGPTRLSLLPDATSPRVDTSTPSRRRVAGAARRRRGRPHGHQHGSAAPVHPRRAADGADPRRRDRHHNQPVIGYLHTGIEKNAEYRPWVQGVHFVTRMDYLSPLVQRAGVLPGGREAARHHRRHPAARAGDPRDPHRARTASPATSSWLATGGMELGRAVGDDLRLPRARGRPRHPRARHRPADEPRVHPPRRRCRWMCPRTSTQRVRELIDVHAQAGSTSSRTCSPRTRSGSSATRASASSPPSSASTTASPGRCCAARASRTTCASRAPYCGIDQYDFDVITPTRATPTAASSSASREMRESLKIVAPGARHPARRPGDGRRHARSPCRRSWPSALTGSATPRSTSARSWASPWRP